METAKEDVDEEQEEVLLVLGTDTVVNPGAVMIHLGDTPAARSAMVTLRSLQRRALLTLTRDEAVELA